VHVRVRSAPAVMELSNPNRLDVPKQGYEGNVELGAGPYSVARHGRRGEHDD
jgi:hypothetical protein